MLPSRAHRLVRVLHEPLRARDGAWDVEAPVEVPQVLGGIERLLERGFSEAQRRTETFELAGIDGHGGIMARERRLCSRPMDPLRGIRRVHQIREYRDEDVPVETVDRLLELARWTGSSRNAQPWHFIVVRDKETLRTIAALRPNIAWLAKAPVGVVIVLDGAGHEYDEGRVTERILTGATLLGYGGGVAWFQDGGNEDTVKRLLEIPKEKVTRQIVMIGRPRSHDDPRPTGPARGRRPLSELVSFERWRQRTR